MVFSNKSVLLIWWPKNWSFSNSPSSEHSRLISLRIDWFDIFAVQGILKGLLQSYNLKLSILQPLALFMIQLSHLYMTTRKTISSVQFSHSVVSDSLRPHESQHARPPCPSPTPGVYANSCPSSQWCHPNISSSVIPFSSCPQFLPASGSFQMRQLFAWGGQSKYCSFSFSISPSN